MSFLDPCRGLGFVCRGCLRLITVLFSDFFTPYQLSAFVWPEPMNFELFSQDFEDDERLHTTQNAASVS